MTLTDDLHTHALLMEDGFTFEAALAWVACPVPWTQSEIRRTAHSWLAMGMGDAGAAAWCYDGWPPIEAAAWRSRGYTLAQANWVEKVLNSLTLRQLTDSDDLAADDRAPGTPHPQPAPKHDHPKVWRDSPLSPFETLLSLATGRITVAAGQAFAADLARDPTLRGSLELELAIRGLHLRSLADGP